MMSSKFDAAHRACGLVLLALLLLVNISHASASSAATASGREILNINADWKFERFANATDGLSYDVLKDWLLPSGNNFIVGPKHQLPSGTPPGQNVTYVKANFDDSAWDGVTLPHDWAIKGPFNAPGVDSAEATLPFDGVGWYRRNVTFAAEDAGKTIFLDIDGAMKYCAVWLNGKFVGGWPYGYNSFRLNLTPFLKEGTNILAIRLENQVQEARWYPGAGLYRNVYLVKVEPVHVGQYGTYITTPTVSSDSAIVNLIVDVENTGNRSQEVSVKTEVYEIDATTDEPASDVVATFPSKSVRVAAGTNQTTNGSITVPSPKLWGPAPEQMPNLYEAVTTVTAGGNGNGNGTARVLDRYSTRFGIRNVTYDADAGLVVNGQRVAVRGTCNHHTLGALGAAYNTRANERQLEILQAMGGNALRTSHNPPAPELLALADRMGFLVYDEIFDCWNDAKTVNDFSIIFPDWSEPDLRSFVRRDRNHASVVAWGFGNEVGEQFDGSNGSVTGAPLKAILRREDPTRPATLALNVAGATSPLADLVDLEGLNYQGDGLGTSNASAFPAFHAAQPGKVLWSSEAAAAVSTRGTYLFPVTDAISAVAADGSGGNSTSLQVSAYELYSASFGSSPDKVFAEQDGLAYVAGEFVWSGFDYLGEPTPYDGARSSYYGVVDLAGFPKDRWHLYRAHWRPDLPAAHLLPHWTWPGREGQVTPVHAFTAAPAAELFVNGVSAGRQTRAPLSWRYRWDNVTYAPGEITVVAYAAASNGSSGEEEWARDSRRTAGPAAALRVTADRAAIAADGRDLSFVTAAVVDSNGTVVPQAADEIEFSVSSSTTGAVVVGVIVATDNGDPADYTAFPSRTRRAFSGLALAIVRADAEGEFVVSAAAQGLESGSVTLRAG
ncbi:glycoside hydrolase family 2 protein [Xylariaceae sp. FL0804]|nr:glycoside hydrolase family 2 protein [Xylariaceae sp. FL0804]